MQETRVHSLGWEDPLEKEMATHFDVLAWEILDTEEPGQLQSMGSQNLATSQQQRMCIYVCVYIYIYSSIPQIDVSVIKDLFVQLNVIFLLYGLLISGSDCMYVSFWDLSISKNFFFFLLKII